MTYLKKAMMWCLIPQYREYRMINGIILGLYWDYIGIILGLYWDYIGIIYKDYMRII